MSEILLSLLVQFGSWILAATTFASCLAIPVPASILMIAAGAFLATGDLAPLTTVVSAILGAVLGDQTGYWIGRRGTAFASRLDRSSGQKQRLAMHAKRLVTDWGKTAIFLTRWLFSPLGPYANVFAGVGGMGWVSFSLASILGESIWVVFYLGVGLVFGGNLAAATDFTGSVIGLLAALAVLALTIAYLRKALSGNTKPRNP